MINDIHMNKNGSRNLNYRIATFASSIVYGNRIYDLLSDVVPEPEQFGYRLDIRGVTMQGDDY